MKPTNTALDKDAQVKQPKISDPGPLHMAKTKNKRPREPCDGEEQGAETNSGVAVEALSMTPLTSPSVTHFPNEKWELVEENILYLDLINVRRDDVRVEDLVFLAEMMTRDDIVVVIKGVAESPYFDRSDWWSVFVKAVGDNRVVHVRWFKKVETDSSESGEVTLFNQYEECGCRLTLTGKEYGSYLDAAKLAKEFRVTKEMGTKKAFKLNTSSNGLYMVDFEFKQYEPKGFSKFMGSFKIPHILTGGEFCCLHRVAASSRADVNGRGFGGPAGHTGWHRDAGGTADAGHVQLRGFSHVILFARHLTKQDYKKAINMLPSEDGRGKAGKCDYFKKGFRWAFVHTVKGDDDNEEPEQRPGWPTKEIFKEWEREGYKPRRLILGPKELVHLNSARPHTFRKVTKENLSPDDCHYDLDAALKKRLGKSVPVDCYWALSMTHDWFFVGFQWCRVMEQMRHSWNNRVENAEAAKTARPGLCVYQLALAHSTTPTLTTPFPGSYRSHEPDPETWTSPPDVQICRGIRDVLGMMCEMEKMTDRLVQYLLSAGRKETLLLTQPEKVAKASTNAKKSPPTIAKKSSFLLVEPDLKARNKPNALDPGYDPLENASKWCGVCFLELFNSYLQCVGCHVHQNLCYNICIGCFIKQEGETQDVSNNYNQVAHRDSTSAFYNHVVCSNALPNPTVGLDVATKSSGCAGHRQDCEYCGGCAVCSCKCHTKYRLRTLYSTIPDLEKLNDRVKARALWADVPSPVKLWMHTNDQNDLPSLLPLVDSQDGSVLKVALECFRLSPGFFEGLKRWDTAKVLVAKSGGAMKVVSKLWALLSKEQKNLRAFNELWKLALGEVEKQPSKRGRKRFCIIFNGLLGYLQEAERLGRGHPMEFLTMVDCLFGGRFKQTQKCSCGSRQVNTMPHLVWSDEPVSLSMASCKDSVLPLDVWMKQNMLPKEVDCKECSKKSVEIATCTEWYQLPKILVLDMGGQNQWAKAAIPPALDLQESRLDGFTITVSYQLLAVMTGEILNGKDSKDSNYSYKVDWNGTSTGKSDATGSEMVMNPEGQHYIIWYCRKVDG